MRAFIRHPSDIPIEIVADANLANGSRPLNNVSMGGLCCQSPIFLTTGRIVRVRFPCGQPAFETEGRVVWCRRRRERDYDVGIEFVLGDDAYKVRMVEQICHIEHYRREVQEREGRTLSGEEAAREWIGKYAAGFYNEGRQDA